jgi:hypothetical protein
LSIANFQLPIGKTRRRLFNRQPAIANRQSPTGNRQPAIGNRQSAIGNSMLPSCRVKRTAAGAAFGIRRRFVPH